MISGPAVVDQLLRELSEKVKVLESKYKQKMQGLKVSNS
jgi:hypothetical protein